MVAIGIVGVALVLIDASGHERDGVSSAITWRQAVCVPQRAGLSLDGGVGRPRSDGLPDPDDPSERDRDFSR
jgi:hypothetical protein